MASPDFEDARRRIISTALERRNAAGGPPERYVAHLSGVEDGEDGQPKPRYIILSVTDADTGFIHKSKANTNGTFSIGKTWNLSELRGIEVINISLTLSRTYRWRSDYPTELSQFAQALIRTHKSIGGQNLRLIGLRDESADLSEPPPSSWSQGSGYPEPSQTSNISYHSSRKLTPTQNGPNSGFDHSPTTPTWPGIQRTLSPVTPSDSNTNKPDTGVNGTTRRSDVDGLRSRSPGPIPSPLTQRAPQLPEPTKPPPLLQTSQLLPPIQPLSPHPKPTPSMPNNPPPSALKLDELGPPLSALPSGLQTALRTAPPSALVTSLPLRPADNPHSRNARISFFDPPNQVLLDRLLATDSAIVTSSGSGGGDNEEESVRATLTNVEEMLDGFEWATEDIFGMSNRGGHGLGSGLAGTGSAEQIEARLLDELMALEKANIYSFIESDDRIDIVVKYLDDAIKELDLMERHVSSYRIHLNEVTDDISYIQSQNRGLQVQTQNQRALMAEIANLLETVDVDRESLITLTQESLEKSKSIQKLEEAAADLYKALQTGRDRDMAAGMERLSEYKTYNSQFCKRIFDYLSIMFTAQSKMLLGDSNGVTKGGNRRRASMVDHKTMEKYLGRYSGLILYLKEMDEAMYAKLCAAYFSAASELHNVQMQALFTAYATSVKKQMEDDIGFAVPPTALAPRTGIRRVGTIRNKSAVDKSGAGDDGLSAPEALGYVLDEIAPSIRRERTFIADFLQINDAALTFADYMGLENYFRRQAMRTSGVSQATLKLVRGAMDLIFGYLPTSVKAWIDTAAAGDSLQVVGVLAALESFASRADERENEFLLKLLEKHHARLKGQFDRHVSEQIKTVEDTKLTSRKRGGVVHFVKYFPVYVGRMEGLMIGTEGLEIRQNVDAAYDRMVQAMFESLKRMAKMDGEGEDKGQLNYHVILIENMHHFVTEIQSLDIGSVSSFLVQAESIYDESLTAYVKLVLRRPFLKILDYFEGIERLLKTTAPTEVQNNSTYSKSALKKVVKEYNAKDVRKHIDALFKRVEKHFEDDGGTSSNLGGLQPGSALPTSKLGANSGLGPDAVVAGVWKACEDEVLRITELFQKRIGQCYANSGVTLEYGPSDVRDGFKRHKV
ncbi:exocyst complex component sec3 subunit [Thelephora terrestris]|uniref:Exocyst complex component sec3 subunit n=1 Tax=Thelephora terrestris TaxID=56493 RepID=A0A9P6HEW2_9AGAM|nr:exocyst complex component sec3 subunit [Thelephora terrestris]